MDKISDAEAALSEAVTAHLTGQWIGVNLDALLSRAGLSYPELREIIVALGQHDRSSLLGTLTLLVERGAAPTRAECETICEKFFVWLIGDFAYNAIQVGEGIGQSRKLVAKIARKLKAHDTDREGWKALQEPLERALRNTRDARSRSILYALTGNIVALKMGSLIKRNITGLLYSISGYGAGTGYERMSAKMLELLRAG